MKNWEDIIKDRLEGYESTLPEGSLAEFRARREGAVAAAPRKRSPLVWIMPTAVAAGLATFFFLRQPDVPESPLQQTQQPSVAVAAAPESAEAQEAAETQNAFEASEASEPARPAQPRPRIAQAAEPEVIPETALETNPVAAPETTPEAANPTQKQEPETAATNPVGKTAVSYPEITESSPYIPENTRKSHTGNIVIPAIGTVGGGGLLAAAILSNRVILGENPGAIIVRAYADIMASDIPYGSTGSGDTKASVNELVKDVHNIPLKLGLSTRFPVADKLYITTGLEHSNYKSSYTYSLSGTETQKEHYLGIPLRLDWVFASVNRFEAYVGAGVQGDIFLNATRVGPSIYDTVIKEQGTFFSLIGAGGLQLNCTEHIGLYVEPQLGWAIPSERHNIPTYRTDKPVYFSVATGLRFTI